MCPDGNEKPPYDVSCSTAGRSRSTRCLRPLLISDTPMPDRRQVTEHRRLAEVPRLDHTDHRHHDQQPPGGTELGDRFEEPASSRRWRCRRRTRRPTGRRRRTPGSRRSCRRSIRPLWRRGRRSRTAAPAPPPPTTRRSAYLQHVTQRRRGVYDEPTFLALGVERRAAPGEGEQHAVGEQTGGDHDRPSPSIVVISSSPDRGGGWTARRRSP